MQVNKDELAGIIKCSLPTLSALLKRYGDDFPCVERGTNGKAYVFDVDAVVSFLDERDKERRQAGVERDELMQQYTLPGTVPDQPAGMKASDILALTRADKLRREQAREAGFLVEKTALRRLLNALFNRLSRRMTSAIRQVCREANIPEAVIRTIESRFADAQREFVKDAQKDLNAGAMQDDDEPALI
jgi:phage terminase Nu1 subunit (DNA packaging protein)